MNRMRKLGLVLTVLLLAAVAAGCPKPKPDLSALEAANPKSICVMPATLGETRPAQLMPAVEEQIRAIVQDQVMLALLEVAPPEIQVYKVTDQEPAPCDARLETNISRLIMVTPQDTARSVASSIVGFVLMFFTGFGWVQSNSALMAVDFALIDNDSGTPLYYFSEQASLPSATFQENFPHQAENLIKAMTRSFKRDFPLKKK